MFRILIIDDSEYDARLIARRLRQDCYEPCSERVETEAELKSALDQRRWDLVLCDYRMPKLDCRTALKMVKEHDPNLPFVLISGAIGIQEAEVIFQIGPDNYLSKDNLNDLSSVIEEELVRAKVKSNRQALAPA